MEYKTGFKWLSRARKIDWCIQDKIVYIESLYTCCGLQGISYDKISVITSPENKFERIMGEIDREKREVERLRQLKEELIYEISEKINVLEPSPEKTVLMKFFIGCKDMKKIAIEMKYQENYCYELRRKGIKKL